jgi:ABC-2 type transport system ATP-binding protein
MADALKLDAVTKQYGQDAPVIRALSHTFAPGTVTVLAGPNGSGKTTLLRLLSVVAYPSDGTVRFGDLDIHAEPYRYLKHVGLVHAEAMLPEHLTGVELLQWVAEARGVGTAGTARAHELLDALGLDDRRDKRIGTYSSGMTKKVQVAAAFVADPAIVLMDEPFRSLDAASTRATVELLRTFRARGGIALVATHRTDVVAPLTDATLTMGAEAASAS